MQNRKEIEIEERDEKQALKTHQSLVLSESVRKRISRRRSVNAMIKRRSIEEISRTAKIVSPKQMHGLTVYYAPKAAIDIAETNASAPQPESQPRVRVLDCSALRYGPVPADSDPGWCRSKD